MTEQNYKNHTRLDPAFHLTLIPLILFLLVSTIVLWWHHHTFARGVGILTAFALLWVAFLARTYALKVQDRVIRLEERLRLQQLGGDAAGVSLRQSVALRFASDAEAAELAGRAAREGMTPKQIKLAVQQWRADHQRV